MARMVRLARGSQSLWTRDVRRWIRPICSRRRAASDIPTAMRSIRASPKLTEPDLAWPASRTADLGIPGRRRRIVSLAMSDKPMFGLGRGIQL